MTHDISLTQTCLFAGESDAPKTLYDEIFLAVGWLYVREGVTAFCCGGSGAFDRMCERAVRSWQQSGADIRLVPFPSTAIHHVLAWVRHDSSPAARQLAEVKRSGAVIHRIGQEKETE